MTLTLYKYPSSLKDSGEIYFAIYDSTEAANSYRRVGIQDLINSTFFGVSSLKNIDGHTGSYNPYAGED